MKTDDWSKAAESQDHRLSAHQMLGSIKEGFSGRFWREMALTSRFGESSLQNCETEQFCCSKPPSWWSFVMGAPETGTTMMKLKVK